MKNKHAALRHRPIEVRVAAAVLAVPRRAERCTKALGKCGVHGVQTWQRAVWHACQRTPGSPAA